MLKRVWVWKREGHLLGGCLSVCGQYVFMTGSPESEDDECYWEDHVSLCAIHAVTGEIVSQAIIECDMNFDWQVSISSKHLRFSSDGLPEQIVSVFAFSDNFDDELWNHFAFRDHQLVPYFGQRIPSVAETFTLRWIDYQLDFEEGIFCDEETGLEEIHLEDAYMEFRAIPNGVARDAEHTEVVVFTGTGRIVRVGMDDPNTALELGEIRGYERHDWGSQIWRASTGGMFMYDDDRLFLYSSEDFFQPHYYRLQWRPDLHSSFPLATRMLIKTFALCMRRVLDGRLPRDIRRLLLKYLVLDF
jgi:hypothetical protein